MLVRSDKLFLILMLLFTIRAQNMLRGEPFDIASIPFGISRPTIRQMEVWSRRRRSECHQINSTSVNARSCHSYYALILNWFPLTLTLGALICIRKRAPVRNKYITGEQNTLQEYIMR